ncbi:hypothetical protein EC991_010524 [Linnemannia zychae]|nr:hypothetical protein EC991_010524 [Linnemannia zychae]
MPISAKTALIEARPYIDAARQAQSTKDIIKQYQDAKNILAKVEPKKEDIHSLKEMIDAFLELAAVLDDAGPTMQDRVKKCKQRADALDTTTIVSVVNNSAATSPANSTGNVVSPAVFIPQQQLRSTPQATVSLSAVIGSPKNPVIFSKKANRETFVYHLPASGEQLETTRQLAYCLALLQNSVDETCLNPDALKWRRSTLEKPDETIRVDAIARQVVAEFINDFEKDATAVEEVVQLAQVLHKDSYRFLLMSLVDTVRNSTLLHYHAMEGLARVIQCATPGSINSDDLVSILQVLYTRIQTIHTSSISHLCRLLLAVSRVLDAIVVAQVGDVDRITLHGPLMARLHEFESNQNHCVAFQAEYAIQALLSVSDNDTIWQAGFRRGFLVLKGVAGFAKIPDPKEIKGALEGLEKLYEAGKGAARMLNNTLVAIKTSEKPTFTAKEGLKFKRIWYPTLRNAEEYIQTGDLVGFKELADGVWNREKGIEQIIFDMISILAINQETDFEAANAFQRMMQQQNFALIPFNNPQSHPWSDFLSVNLTFHDTPTSNLLMAVQNKKKHEERVNMIQSGFENIVEQLRPSQYSLKDIQSALKTHHSPGLKILRISGDKLDIDTCFVNLAIVEATAQREKEKQKLKEQAAVFHRIPSSEAVRGSNIKSSIRLEQLFDKRKLRDGKEGIPQRILVQGRAGIGKTTLCKKIVHLHQSGLWADRFEAVLWLPLRRLRGSTCRTLETLLREKVFTSQLDREHEELARTLVIRADKGKVLFILDGLDEIVTDAQSEDSSTKALLRDLLNQKQVVITSRPSGLDASLLLSIDLELETIGFSQQVVKEFIVRVLKPEPAKAVQDFIKQTPLIQGLVNIPVQLDVICFCWESLPQDGSQVTITMLYQLMSRRLWRKDAIRLKKDRGGRVLKKSHIGRMSSKEIDRLMSTELRHLGHLAFKRLRNEHQIEFDEATLLESFEDLAETDPIDDNSLTRLNCLKW